MPKNALARVLLDFGRTPGRYALRLREPAELHAQIDTLALWALGRVPEGLQAQAQEIKAAAVMFIQRACFAPENNHYQILGLPQGPVDAELLRTRYRALIRLTHPDMGVEGLPANAAGLVNRAQKVLADPALRERYDQELENEAWPRWRTAPPVAGAASAPFARKPEAHWAASKSRLGGGESWSALWARYPLQARLLLTATGVGALVVALLAWAANDTPGGAMLVVARAPSGGSAKPDAARPAKPQAGERTRASQPGAAPASSAPQAWAAANGDLYDSASLQLSRDTRNTWPATRPLPADPGRANPRQRDSSDNAPAGTRLAGRVADSVADGLVNDPPAGAAAPWPRAQPRPAPDDVTVAQAQPRAAPAPMPTVARADHDTAAPVAAEPWPAAARPIPAAPPPMPAPTAVRTPAPAAAAPPAPPAAPAPQPAPATVAPAQAAAPSPPPAAAAPAQAAQWSVDAPGATQYLRDLMATLERPQDAQRAQDLLRKMDVKGNLLAPGLRLGREYPRLKVTLLTLSESPRPSALELRGTVLVTASNPQTAAATTVRYRLAAHFVGMPEGTAMSRLELVETE